MAVYDSAYPFLRCSLLYIFHYPFSINRQYVKSMKRPRAFCCELRKPRVTTNTAFRRVKSQQYLLIVRNHRFRKLIFDIYFYRRLNSSSAYDQSVIRNIQFPIIAGSSSYVELSFLGSRAEELKYVYYKLVVYSLRINYYSNQCCSLPRHIHPNCWIF